MQDEDINSAWATGIADLNSTIDEMNGKASTKLK